jgi:pimeloyl-ACP methyl ester carboxylesterase
VTRPVVRSVVVLLLGGLGLSSFVSLAVGAEPADLACGQEPGNRYFWVERAFCDMPAHGPERAAGIVIWNHGISGTTQSWRAPAPPAFRLLQARGWDVVMLKRHHQAEVNDTLARTVQRTLEEAAAARKLGYRKVVLGGQSFGGYVTLDAIDTSPDIDAAIAFAPGVRPGGATGRLDASVTDRLLQRAKVGRLAILFPTNDEVFNYTVRGENAQTILSRRGLPYLLLDETSGLSGHGAGVTGAFALRYGLCLVEFLAAPTLPAGRFTCPAAGEGWAVTRELPLGSLAQPPTFVGDGPDLPDPYRALTGPRWGMLADTIVLIGLVEESPGRLRLLYRSTTGFGAGVFDASVKDGVIRATLANGATITLKPGGDGTLTWTASDGSRSLQAPLTRGRDAP